MNKLKLLTICFSAALCTLNINAMDYSAMAAEQADYDADHLALGGVQTLSAFADLPDERTDRLHPDFKKEVKEASIKKDPEHKLPADMYKGKDGINGDAANAIGTNLMVVLNGGGGAPTNGDGVSQALEILYGVIFTTAHIDDGGNVVRVDTVRHFGEDVETILADGVGYDTTQYLLALSEILQAGRNGANDFSNIQVAVMPSFLHFIREMVSVALPAELGIN